MADKDHARPLAPAVERQSSDEEEASQQHTTKHLSRRRRKCVRYTSCMAACMLILASIIIALIFTVFRVKEPIIKMNGVTVTKLKMVNEAIPKPGVNMSLLVDVSVKNPNVASFKYKNTTTMLFYDGDVVGEARGPPGQAKARRTMRVNITVDIITDRIMLSPNLGQDLASGMLSMSSYSRVPGRVKILNVIKKHVVVEMNCTMTVNITSRRIQEQKCKRHVDLNF